MANNRFELIVQESAAKEVLEALVYYKGIGFQLSQRLKFEVRKSIRSIKRNPYSFQVRFDDIRLYHLQTFPYSIHFEIDIDIKLVKILAFLHQNQGPGEKGEL